MLTKIEIEFSTAWCYQHPELAAQKIVQAIETVREAEMSFGFDFSNPGSFTIKGERKE